MKAHCVTCLAAGLCSHATCCLLIKNRKHIYTDNVFEDMADDGNPGLTVFLIRLIYYRL